MRLMPLLCLLASTVAAQQEDSYLGPGVLSRGAGEIGNRSGAQVNLRFYAGISGIYDNDFQPVSVDSKGNLVSVSGLYGEEAALGAYGTHVWKSALLGLDYFGTFRHYENDSYFDGSDQSLRLGYTYRKSRRMVFDFRETAGTRSLAVGGLNASEAPTSTDTVNQLAPLIFDDRMYYLQSTVDASYALSARTIVTVGGDGFLTRYQSSALTRMNGYDLRGSIQHRMSRITTLGATYQHGHYDYPNVFGKTDYDMGQAFVATKFGPRWTFSLAAGVYRAETAGLQQVSLDPAIVALTGISFTTQTYSATTLAPSGDVKLTRQFRSALMRLQYTRAITPGNGVYLASRTEDATGLFSYTGIRKWEFSIRGGYDSLSSIGQSITPYNQATGGAGITYGIGRYIHIVARYDLNHRDLTLVGFRPTGYRASLGLTFSPGNVPLSLW